MATAKPQRRRRILAWGLLWMGGLLLLGLGEVHGAEAPRTSAPGVQRTVEVHGPFALGSGAERTLSVRATIETLGGIPASAWARTLTRYEILDGRGRLLYLEHVGNQMAPDGGFNEEISLGAALVRGRDRRFLLVTLGFEPSAPSGGTTYHFFGFDRAGRLKRLGEPIPQQGEALRNPMDSTSKVLDLIEGRYLEFGEWTGTFSLILRRQFVEGEERFALTGLCGPVQVAPGTPEEASIFLYASPGPSFPKERIRVHPRSRIEFLEGCRAYGVTDPKSYAPWLRIRIDGKTGWVPSEDTPRLGLQEAG